LFSINRFTPLPLCLKGGIICNEFLIKTINTVKALAKALVAFTIPLFVSACGNTQTVQQNPPVSSPIAATTTSASPVIATSYPNQKTSSSAKKINVTETEMAIKLSSATAPAGSIDFIVYNSGKIPHEFVVFKRVCQTTNSLLRETIWMKKVKVSNILLRLAPTSLKVGRPKHSMLTSLLVAMY
jgi:hypothetical protein